MLVRTQTTNLRGRAREEPRTREIPLTTPVRLTGRNAEKLKRNSPGRSERSTQCAPGYAARVTACARSRSPTRQTYNSTNWSYKISLLSEAMLPGRGDIFATRNIGHRSSSELASPPSRAVRLMLWAAEMARALRAGGAEVGTTLRRRTYR